MAKAAGVLNRLLGKKVVFSGRFGYDLRELKALAEAQQGIIEEELSPSTDYLVLADPASGKTIQKKVASLNAKGASIQVISSTDFDKLITPTDDEVLALIKSGAKFADIFNKAANRGALAHHLNAHPRRTIAGENFDGLDLTGFSFCESSFDGCSFVGAKLSVSIQSARRCNFSNAIATGMEFGDVSGSSFKNAVLDQSAFEGQSDQADFTGATLTKARFSSYYAPHTKRTPVQGVIFRNALMTSAQLADLHAIAADLEGADCTGANFAGAQFEKGNFRKAILRDANMMDCKLTDADFSNADLRGTTFSNSDLTNAKFDGANLAGCNLRNAKLTGVNFDKAKGYNPNPALGAAGPALKELDTLSKKARRIHITFHVRKDEKDEGEEVGIDTAGLVYGWPLRMPYTMARQQSRNRRTTVFSDAMLELADLVGHRLVRYETVDISTSKCPSGGKELRDLVLSGISEAFAQPLPNAEDLAKATKEIREAKRDQGAADRERREKAKAEAEKARAKEVKQSEKKIAKAIGGKVTDIATFLKALELRADKQKIDKATKMLKAERFKLFNDIADTHLAGVVKSQTDPDLVYACRIEDGGKYACCTQNLNICGGLRGSICKHLLVLIIGLVKAGELDPGTIDGWVAKSQHAKPELDKEIMGEIFIRYKGAEAGEVDWRPTETLPEDYYAL